MRALTVFDSKYGNTARVAHAISEAIGGQLLSVSDLDPSHLERIELLILGSPTNGGRPTEAVYRLLQGPLLLEGIRAAAFDTRTVSIWNRILPFGYAAPRIASSLETHGARLVAPPEGFVVLGIKGPLKVGELERAAIWAKQIAG